MSPKRQPKKKAKSATEQEPLCDSYHNDPDAKVILVSSDNVSFRVHAWYLKQKSEFIKGLLDVPSDQSLENAPIQLNQIAEYVRALLNYVYSTSAIPISSAKECLALFEMCDHLQMPTVEVIIWRTAKAQLNDPRSDGLSPWETFKLGAARDMPQLCGAALLALTETHSLAAICHQPADFYRDIPSRYIATLLTNTYYPDGSSYQQHSLSDIADRFVAMRKE